MNSRREPQTFDDMIGQAHIISLLRKEARTANPAHVLLSGPPGMGKTQLTRCFAREIGAEFVEFQSGPMLTPKTVTRTLFDLDRTGYAPGGHRGPGGKRYVVFFDEVSELQDTVFLHSVLLDGELNPDPYGRISWVPDMTIVAATNWPNELSEPFKSRFPIKLRVDPYALPDLVAMIARAYPGLKHEDVSDVAGRSRGSARMALDYAMLAVRHGMDVFEAQGVDSSGLRPVDRAYLAALTRVGHALSLSTVSAMIMEDPRVVRQEIEPYLLMTHRIEITPKGRQLTGSDAALNPGRRSTAKTPERSAKTPTEAYLSDTC